MKPLPALTVPCPQCKAAPGEPCKATSRTRNGKTHDRRHAAANPPGYWKPKDKKRTP